MAERDKSKALETTLATIQKRYGEGSIMRLGQAGHLHVEAIPTGSLAVDLALGVGGVPRGRVTEIYGPEGSGKTTLAQHIVAEAQRMGGVAAFIDMEHALDPVYAAKCGVNVEELYISQPDTGEQALEIAEALAARDGDSPKRIGGFTAPSGSFTGRIGSCPDDWAKSSPSICRCP